MQSQLSHQLRQLRIDVDLHPQRPSDSDVGNLSNPNEAEDSTLVSLSPPRPALDKASHSGFSSNTPDTPSIDMAESPVVMQHPPTGAVVPRPSLNRTPSGSFGARRPQLRLTLSSEEQANFSAAIQSSRMQCVQRCATKQAITATILTLSSHYSLASDASKLPASTNMGLGNTKQSEPAPKPRSVVKAAAHPWPIPQPVADKERTQVNEHEEIMKAHDAQAHSWEESETFERSSECFSHVFTLVDADTSGGFCLFSAPASQSPDSPKSKAVFLRAIPCMYVANVANATSFYKDIIGFSLLGKPDNSHASLVRSSTLAEGPKQRGTLKHAPADAVQVYLRLAPVGPDGERVMPPPTTLWIMVNDVDEVFAELQTKWARYQPRVDEYFPMHTFGDAKILAKPQNKAWGNRELHLVDGDGNKIIFFRELY